MRNTQNGSSHAPVLAVLATVALSVILFFLFTLPKSKQDQTGTNPDGGAAGEAPAPPEGGSQTGKAGTQNGAVPKAGEAAAFASSPAALIGEVSKRIANGDLAGVGELFGKDSASAEALASAFGPDGYTPTPDRNPEEVGPVGDADRWVLPLSKRGATLTADSPVHRLHLDLLKGASPAGDPAWSIGNVHFPPALQELIASVSPLDAQEQGEQDAMTMADGFITAINDKDFVAALKACSPDTVPEEKIAGLCIVFEEGQFTLRDEKPLVATALGNDKAWVIAHVVSPKLDSGSEFGLVMRRLDGAAADATGENGAWQISEINFGKLLDSYVTASDAGKVPYTPIKSSPGSGELLVLYFEYDDTAILPRAKRQLEILSGILRADGGKQLTIAGHADASGSEDYNVSLSAARAAAVKTQLNEFGVPKTQVLTRGFGEAKPWKPNAREDGSDDPKGRSYNRRAELYLDF